MVLFYRIINYLLPLLVIINYFNFGYWDLIRLNKLYRDIDLISYCKLELRINTSSDSDSTEDSISNSGKHIDESLSILLEKYNDDSIEAIVSDISVLDKILKENFVSENEQILLLDLCNELKDAIDAVIRAINWYSYEHKKNKNIIGSLKLAYNSKNSEEIDKLIIVNRSYHMKANKLKIRLKNLEIFFSRYCMHRIKRYKFLLGATRYGKFLTTKEERDEIREKFNNLYIPSLILRNECMKSKILKRCTKLSPCKSCLELQKNYSSSFENSLKKLNRIERNKNKLLRNNEEFLDERAEYNRILSKLINLNIDEFKDDKSKSNDSDKNIITGNSDGMNEYLEKTLENVNSDEDQFELDVKSQELSNKSLSKSLKPLKLLKPKKPSTLSIPSTSLKPSKPLKPSTSSTPSTPSTPLKTSTPLKPSTSSKYLRPSTSSTPSTPSTPLKPSTSSIPSTPLKPSTLSISSTPLKPSTSSIPSTPSTPLKPSILSKPLKQSTSSTPSTPLTPSIQNSQELDKLTEISLKNKDLNNISFNEESSILEKVVSPTDKNPDNILPKDANMKSYYSESARSILSRKGSFVTKRLLEKIEERRRIRMERELKGYKKPLKPQTSIKRKYSFIKTSQINRNEAENRRKLLVDYLKKDDLSDLNRKLILKTLNRSSNGKDSIKLESYDESLSLSKKDKETTISSKISDSNSILKNEEENSSKNLKLNKETSSTNKSLTDTELLNNKKKLRRREAFRREQPSYKLPLFLKQQLESKEESKSKQLPHNENLKSSFSKKDLLEISEKDLKLKDLLKDNINISDESSDSEKNKLPSSNLISKPSSTLDMNKSQSSEKSISEIPEKSSLELPPKPRPRSLSKTLSELKIESSLELPPKPRPRSLSKTLSELKIESPLELPPKPRPRSLSKTLSDLKIESSLELPPKPRPRSLSKTFSELTIESSSESVPKPRPRSLSKAFSELTIESSLELPPKPRPRSLSKTLSELTIESSIESSLEAGPRSTSKSNSEIPRESSLGSPPKPRPRSLLKLPLVSPLKPLSKSLSKSTSELPTKSSLSSPSRLNPKSLSKSILEIPKELSLISALKQRSTSLSKSISELTTESSIESSLEAGPRSSLISNSGSPPKPRPRSLSKSISELSTETSLGSLSETRSKPLPKISLDSKYSVHSELPTIPESEFPSTLDSNIKSKLTQKVKIPTSTTIQRLKKLSESNSFRKSKSLKSNNKKLESHSLKELESLSNSKLTQESELSSNLSKSHKLNSKKKSSKNQNLHKSNSQKIELPKLSQVFISPHSKKDLLEKKTDEFSSEINNSQLSSKINSLTQENNLENKEKIDDLINKKEPINSELYNNAMLSNEDSSKIKETLKSTEYQINTQLDIDNKNEALNIKSDVNLKENVSGFYSTTLPNLSSQTSTQNSGISKLKSIIKSTDTSKLSKKKKKVKLVHKISDSSGSSDLRNINPSNSGKLFKPKDSIMNLSSSSLGINTVLPQLPITNKLADLKSQEDLKDELLEGTNSMFKITELLNSELPSSKQEIFKTNEEDTLKSFSNILIEPSNSNTQKITSEKDKTLSSNISFKLSKKFLRSQISSVKSYNKVNDNLLLLKDQSNSPKLTVNRTHQKHGKSNSSKLSSEMNKDRRSKSSTRLHNTDNFSSKASSTTLTKTKLFRVPESSNSGIQDANTKTSGAFEKKRRSSLNSAQRINSNPKMNETDSRLKKQLVTKIKKHKSELLKRPLLSLKNRSSRSIQSKPSNRFSREQLLRYGNVLPLTIENLRIFDLQNPREKSFDYFFRNNYPSSDSDNDLSKTHHTIESNSNTNSNNLVDNKALVVRNVKRRSRQNRRN